MKPKTDWRLGPLVPEPAEFKPTATHTDQDYLYQLDFKSGVAKRLPLHWDSVEPSGFFALLLPEQPIEPPVAAAPVKVMPKRRWPRRTLASLCSAAMLAGCFMLVYPFYPAAWQRVERQFTVFDAQLMAADVPTMPTQWGANQVIIPKIGVRAAILESDSQAILDQKEGVWHQKGDLKTNLVLAGHRFRFLPPNTSTFYNLGQLQPGDVILVDWYNRRYAYTVKQTATVDQKQTEVLRDDGRAHLTLYTCNDEKETQRLVVVADPQE